MITPELITYIEAELRRSVSKDAIQNALIGAGWKPTEVAEAFHVVEERAAKGETTPYIPPAIIHETTPEAPISFSLQTKEDSSYSATKHVVSTPGHLEQFTGVTLSEKKKSPIAPLLVISAALILLGVGYVFIKPFLTSPKTYVALIEKEITTAKSITFSGSYEITAPATLIFPDPVLLSSFGGIVARTQTAKIKASFFGTDDWYDLRAKKNEIKINATASVASSKEVSFPSSVRRISESLYVKLPETGSLFDPTATAAGANWLRYDTNDFVAAYAYGFLGNTKLYENTLPRFLMPILASAVVTAEPTSVPPLSTLTVAYDPKTVTELFSESLFTGDAFQNSQVFTSRYTITGFSQSPYGELSFDKSRMLRKASIVFGFDTKEYATPIHVQLDLSLDGYNTPPAINIPTQVISLAELKKQSALLTVPEGLRPFFTDIHTITSIFKGTNKDSFKGVCADAEGGATDESALTISVVTSKLASAGYPGGICKDTSTAWMYYVPNPTENSFFCTDSRDFSGKTSREPIGEKCN